MKTDLIYSGLTFLVGSSLTFGYMSTKEAMCKCKDKKCIYKRTVKDSLNDSVVIFCNVARIISGKPMRYNSVLRCRNHKEERLKKKHGSHAQGNAVDIVLNKKNNTMQSIVTAITLFNTGQIAGVEPVQGIGIANSFIHIDFGHAHVKRPALWYYDGVDPSPYEDYLRFLLKQP